MNALRDHIQDLITEVIDVCQNEEIKGDDFKQYMKDIEDDYVDRFRELIKITLDNHVQPRETK